MVLMLSKVLALYVKTDYELLTMALIYLVYFYPVAADWKTSSSLGIVSMNCNYSTQ